MNNYIYLQQEIIKKIIISLGYQTDNVLIYKSSKPELGQFQYNGVMDIAKVYNKNPIDIANKIVEELKKLSNYSNINIAGPGFINITFSDNSLIEYMNIINNDININKGILLNKKLLIDYGGANVAKALHVGHLRSAIIGEALKRLSIELGCESYSDVHLGDWGRPMGLVLLEIKKRYPNLNYFDENFIGEYSECPINNEDLEEIYPVASIKAKEDPVFLEEARIITSYIQEKRKGYYDLWKKIVEISSNEIKKIYERLNVYFDFWNGESNSDKYVNEMINYLKINNYSKESDGAIIIDVAKEDDKAPMPPLLLVKSNNALSYETTDLAMIYGYMKELNPDEMLYITDQRQSLHFEQVFRAAYKSKIVSNDKILEFIGFGTMNGKDGKPFKTRDGGTMKLVDLINIVKEETLKNIGPNILEEEKDYIAEKVAIASLKYADFLSNRTSDYVFDPVKFTDLNGKTGAYILYSTIRMKSLLDKAKEGNVEYKNISVLFDIDRNIVLKLLEVPKVLEISYKTKSLNPIADFLFEISNLYNNLYSNNRILTEENNNIKESRLVLTEIVYKTSRKLIDILGIEVPNKI